MPPRVKAAVPAVGGSGWRNEPHALRGGQDQPSSPKFPTLLAGEVTECSENCHAVEGRRDFRDYVATAKLGAC